MTSKTLSVYDPAMCCSTGVCGVDVDAQLVRFASDVAWLDAQGVTVERFNLAQQPGEFVAAAPVKAALDEAGEAALPMFLVGSRTVMSGAYPTRDQLAGWFGLSTVQAATSGCSPKSGCC